MVPVADSSKYYCNVVRVAKTCWNGGKVNTKFGNAKGGATCEN